MLGSDHFSAKVLDWFDSCGRKHLPWQKEVTPYRVWVSEIMLQQTQVATVIPYFEKFMLSFPNVDTLAAASQDEVLAHWSGLGYYARGRNLHKAAGLVVEQYAGRFPCEASLLESLPGVGRSTAAAIASIACNQAEVILDGNVKRVLARYHAVEGWPGKSSVLKQLWQHAESHKPSFRYGDYSQAMMDLGATLCTRTKPDCPRCPVDEGCSALERGTPTIFPFPKPKKSRPTKTRRFLLLRNAQGEVLLQKRAASGLWGGLWSFPELDEGDDVVSAVGASYGCNVLRQESWPVIDHAFSHYDLTILPTVVILGASLEGVMEMEQQQTVWYNTRHSLPGGIPSPVRQLIQQIHAAHLPECIEK